MKKGKVQKTAVALTAMMVALAVGNKSVAMPINTGDSDWQVNWDTTVSASAMWRAQDPSSSLYTAANGNVVGLQSGQGGTIADSGNLNYKKGDLVSNLYKVVTDVDVKHGDFGGLLRVKAWYDHAEEDNRVHFGNQANGYTPNAPLSDSGFSTLQKFRAVKLLDAYMYDTFDVADHPLQIRMGHQVINWGESMFVQGINQINPIDVLALRRPGTEIKEALLPVWSAYANLGLGGGVSFETFYQFNFEPTQVDACGTYWSVVDTNIGTNPGNCNNILIGLTTSQTALAGSLAPFASWAPLTQGRDPRADGQFGAAIKVPVDAIDTEFGLYGMNVHSRTPIISSRTGTWGNWAAFFGAPPPLVNPVMLFQTLGAPLGVKSASGFWEYPEDVQYYGASAATNLAGWSLGAEVSYTPNLPVQRNGNDMINAMLTGAGPLGSTYLKAGSLSEVKGYDRFDKTQFQINGIKVLSGVLGSSKTTLLGEAAFQWNGVPDYKDGTSIRYGRNFIFGVGSSAGNNTCNGSNPHPEGCKNDGYVTDFAWGYRLRGSLEYPQIFNTAVTFTPTLFIAHDVQGVSADNQMIENRFQTGLTANFSYDNRYNVELGYVYFGDWATYDPLRDRDYYSMTFSASF